MIIETQILWVWPADEDVTGHIQPVVLSPPRPHQHGVVLLEGPIYHNLPCLDADDDTGIVGYNI